MLTMTHVCTMSTTDAIHHVLGIGTSTCILSCRGLYEFSARQSGTPLGYLSET